MTDVNPISGTYGSRVVEVVTPVDNDPVALERFESIPDASDIQIFRQYASGKQCLSLTNEQRQTLEGLPIETFADNLIKQILDINKDRLKVTGFKVDAPDGMPEAEGAVVAETNQKWIKNFWIKEQFDRHQNKTNKAVIRDGDHYNGLAWDEVTQRVLLFQKPAWDGRTGMYMAYGDNGLPMYAVNEWIEKESDAQYVGKSSIARKFLDSALKLIGQPGQTPPTAKTYRYRTIYFPDRIEKYRKDEAGNTWEQNHPEGEPWPLPNLKRDGSPLGIPVVHFSVGGDGHYGQSVTPLEVIANQDFLNDTRMDLAGVGRQTGFQRVVLSGFPAYQQNADGTPNYAEPMLYQNAPGVFYISENPDASGRAIEPGSTDGLISIYNLTLESMSRQTGTPFYLLTVSGNTSGAAILRAEAPLAGKAQEQTESLGPSYVMLIHQAMEIYNAKNREGITLNEDALITVEWADTSKPDESAVVELDIARINRDRAKRVDELEAEAIASGKQIYLAADETAQRLAVQMANKAQEPVTA